MIIVFLKELVKWLVFKDRFKIMVIIGNRLFKYCKISDVGKGLSGYYFLDVLLIIVMILFIVSYY